MLKNTKRSMEEKMAKLGFATIRRKYLVPLGLLAVISCVWATAEVSTQELEQGGTILPALPIEDPNVWAMLGATVTENFGTEVLFVVTFDNRGHAQLWHGPNGRRIDPPDSFTDFWPAAISVTNPGCLKLGGDQQCSTNG
jgi:hypothetical protein